MHTYTRSASLIIVSAILFLGMGILTAFAQSGTLPEETRTQITNLTITLIDDTDAKIVQLDDITVRLSDAVRSLEQKGYVMENARTQIMQAQASIEEASIQLGSLEEDMQTILASEDPSAGWASLKNALLLMKANLEEGAAFLQQSITTARDILSSESQTRNDAAETTAVETGATTTPEEETAQ